MKVTPFETYQHYLSLKNHFTNPKYDFFKYGKKTRASVTSFNKRRDKYWFEKTSRKYSDDEVVQFLVSNFLLPIIHKTYGLEKLSILEKEPTQSGRETTELKPYLFKEQSEKLFSDNKFEDVFKCSKTTSHPLILKKYLGGEISLETIVIYEKIFKFCQSYDKKLKDPVWETVSLKIKKYLPFLNIDIFKYKKKTLRQILNE